MWTALLEQLDGGLRVLVHGNMNISDLYPDNQIHLDCFAGKLANNTSKTVLLLYMYEMSLLLTTTMILTVHLQGN